VDRKSKRDFSANPAAEQPPGTLSGDPGGTHSRRWGRRWWASSLPRTAAIWADLHRLASEVPLATRLLLHAGAGGAGTSSPQPRDTPFLPPRRCRLALVPRSVTPCRTPVRRCWAPGEMTSSFSKLKQGFIVGCLGQISFD